MMMDSKQQQYLAAACALTGDPVEAVLSHRFAGDSLILVINRGIAGCPKFEYSLAELQPPPVAPPPPPPQPDTPVDKSRSARKRK